VHRVWVDVFELAECQVTRSEYAQFLAACNYPKPPQWDDPNFSDADQPVVATSWFDAAAYCEWLSRNTGNRYRLPTEAEWERAARGGIEHKQFPWGDDPPESLANYAARWKTGPEPVGRAEKNAYGLYDIGANVHEMVRGLVSGGLLFGFERPKSKRAGIGVASSFARRVMAALYQRYRAARPVPASRRISYADYGFRVARDS